MTLAPEYDRLFIDKQSTEQAALAVVEAIRTLPEHHERKRERIRARTQLTADRQQG